MEGDASQVAHRRPDVVGHDELATVGVVRGPGRQVDHPPDHIALTVPDLDDQVDRLESAFGMVVEARSDFFALITDPASGLKLELSRSDDSEVHFRHFGFRADDVDVAHESLVEAGMETSEAPHRRDFAGMYTSFLKQRGGLEVQLVKYDERS